MTPITSFLGRWQRPIAVSVILVILLLAIFPRHHREAIHDTYTNYFPPKTSHSTAAAASGTAVTDYAHHFKTPDDFKPHFFQVAKLSPIDVQDAKRTCFWNDEDYRKQQFQWGPDQDWFANQSTLAETEARRQEWHEFVANDLVPWESVKGKHKGRGIVTLAGHGDTIPRVAILMRQLVRLGSKLPVEIHFWEDEMNEESKAFLNAIYPRIRYNDLSASDNFWKTHGPTERNYGHYHFKTAAVVDTLFSEFLLLDSDNIPLTLPEDLFEAPTYKEYGTVFWPDIARTRHQNPIWAITRTFCNPAEYEQESGQMLVNKSKFFYHLQLAAWFNEQDYYKHLLLGDKDMFRFAWHALKTPYGKPSKWLTSGGTSHDGNYCGHTFIQAHPDNGEMAFLHRGYFKGMKAPALKWFRERGGVFQKFKQSKYPEDFAFPQESVWGGTGIEGVEGGWHCMGLEGVDEQPMDDLIPGINELFEELGGYWMVDEEEKEKQGR
ncbi:hypothetical protein B0A48_09362 [Cryoendolithus antarcticus]|uniref:Glycosyltransferase family 71 protein n=1 Tax=Cryoendolithus antarcticus TaxID=1507870 RepID=A0A1V8SZE0_9PEZI|nr:hypothetical protein B0A48_09362 [Cryoendolithus antarcticus]